MQPLLVCDGAAEYLGRRAATYLREIPHHRERLAPQRHRHTAISPPATIPPATPNNTAPRHAVGAHSCVYRLRRQSCSSALLMMCCTVVAVTPHALAISL